MPVEEVETLVIGAGQAGIAMSEHLARRGLPHLILERGRVADRWRSERWDSLVANGPAWHDRFPGAEFRGIGPDDFATRSGIVDYLAEYAARVGAPIRCGVEVQALRVDVDRPGFRIETSAGTFAARNVVSATGPFQKPVIPPVVPDSAGVLQIHSSAYRNPEMLPDGGVLVVGSGSSGVQIAEELARAGRPVHLSVGPHERPFRRYRGRDFVWWLGVLGKWDATRCAPGREHVTIAVSGARGGHTVDFRDLAALGVGLVGRTEGFGNGGVHFARDLAANIAAGDADYLALLDEADGHVRLYGLDLPVDLGARVLGPPTIWERDPVMKLELRSAGVTSIIWATGYALDLGWVKADIFDQRGWPVHDGGVTRIPGLYFLGLPWLASRASAFLWGVWRDADRLAAHLADRTGLAAN